MEIIQKSNKMTPEKRIEQIWKENSKIPFMQSKDILALGFNKGMEYSSVSNTKNTKDGSFVGNTKEIIEYGNRVLKLSELSDLEKENIKLDIINEILDFITDKRDLMETYTKVKDMKSSINKRIKNLQKKNG